MNKRRIRAAIRLMEKAQNLDMEYFQHRNQYGPNNKSRICHTVESLHRCGNTACLAGYIGVSRPFKRAGGSINNSGWPVFKEQVGTWAIAAYFEIPYRDATALTQPFAGHAYPVRFCDVKPKHVIEALQRLLKTGDPRP